jgi:peptidoglycan/LPS O-acetylase OafA/YrhL
VKAVDRDVTNPPILSLTGARFFACLFVVLFHTEYVWLDQTTLIDGPIRNIMKSGFSGVGFFFILSGFVLGYRYGGETADFPYHRYFVARFARIYPALFFSLLVAAPVALAAGLAPDGDLTLGGLGPVESVVITFLGNAAVLSAWFPKIAYWNYPAWSLACEVFFYALFPAFCVLVWKGGERAAWVSCAGLVVACALLQSLALDGPIPIETVFVFPPFRFLQFGIGVVLARAFLLSKRERSSALAMVPMLVLLVVFALSNRFSRDYLHTGWIDIASLLTIYFLAQRGSFLTRLLSHPWLLLLGESSYSLYLLHVPLRDTTRAVVNRVEVLQQLPQELIFFTFLLFSILASVLTFKYLEAPARRRINAWGRAEAAPPPAPREASRTSAVAESS